MRATACSCVVLKIPALQFLAAVKSRQTAGQMRGTCEWTISHRKVWTSSLVLRRVEMMSQAGVQALCVVSDKRGFFSQSKALARQLPHTCFEEPPVATKSGSTSGVTSSTGTL